MHGHGETNGPGYGVREQMGSKTSSVCFLLLKKIPDSIKDQVLEGSVALQSFYLLPSYPTC